MLLGPLNDGALLKPPTFAGTAQGCLGHDSPRGPERWRRGQGATLEAGREGSGWGRGHLLQWRCSGGEGAPSEVTSRPLPESPGLQLRAGLDLCYCFVGAGTAMFHLRPCPSHLWANLLSALLLGVAQAVGSRRDKRRGVGTC